MKRHKFIFIIGGVMSGVGKGVASASIAKILQSRGLLVSSIKIDPYLNVDAGTMNPIEHGEVFVLSSGLECDQDMGNYERFLDLEIPGENYMTNGMIFKTVIDREGNLGYGGACVEPTYHISQEIIQRITHSAEMTKVDVTIIEIGGTVGEYQNAIFIEAARIMKLKHSNDVLFALVSYLPIPGTIGEMKTKPTQSAVHTLNSYGVHPDIIIARGAYRLDEKRKMKIGDMCSIPYKNIISAPDVSNIYEVPLNFEQDGLTNILLRRLRLKSQKNSDLSAWKRLIEKAKKSEENITIAMIGKYFKTGDYVLSDVYISIIESLKHAAYHLDRKLSIEWIDSQKMEKNQTSGEELAAYDGILVPGGFGSRGIEGIIAGIRYARMNAIPYFGICYGMQLALIEYARHVMELEGAHTTEVSKKTPYPVIDIMPEQIANLRDNRYGGTMRLGSYPAVLKMGTIAHRLYAESKEGRWADSRLRNQLVIKERHRHRYEVNPQYIGRFEKSGVMFSGTSPDQILMEIMELPHDVHPYFIGTQFHPEFTGSFLNPHPLFVGFVQAAVARKTANRN